MSRIWTYVINKDLGDSEIETLRADGSGFVNQWTAHENKLTASFEIFKKRIIIVKVNEDINAASGCSIDKLTRFIKDLEKKYSIELMNRFLVAYKKQDEIEIVEASAIKDLLNKNIISENTIVYNTSLSNSNDLIGWEQELKNTWLCKYLDI